jgi:hypothetical protein
MSKIVIVNILLVLAAALDFIFKNSLLPSYTIYIQLAIVLVGAVINAINGQVMVNKVADLKVRLSVLQYKLKKFSGYSE